jgi:hypothetical protein
LSATRPIRLSLKSPALVALLLCSASLVFYWTSLAHANPSDANNISLMKASALTDLYPRWYGARELLLHHRDPYSADVTEEIQLAYDGREQRFNYPLYVILFLAPTVRMPFHSAQIVFWWLLVLVTGLSVALWLYVIPLQLTLLARVTLFAMVLCSVPVLQGLRLLQFGLLVAGLLAAAVAAILAGHLFLAGMLLALATIKPPLSLLAISWFVVWVAGDWNRRRTLLWGFALTIAILVLASELLVPGWVLRYPAVLALYAKHADATPLSGVFLPHSLQWLLTLCGLLAVARFCWSMRRQPVSSSHFILAYSFVATLTLLIIPTALSPYNQVLLLPAVLLILHHWTDLWSRGFLHRIVVSLLAGVGILPWLLASLVTVGVLAPARAWFLKLDLIPLYSSLELPFAILGLLLLLARSLRLPAHNSHTKYPARAYISGSIG